MGHSKLLTRHDPVTLPQTDICCFTTKPFGPPCLQSERLQANWYSKARDLIEMAEQEARTLAIPVRFLLKLREGLTQSPVEEEQSLNGVPNGRAGEKVSLPQM